MCGPPIKACAPIDIDTQSFVPALPAEAARLDARIQSLESLATQATLLAGFSYAVMQPNNISSVVTEFNSIPVMMASAVSFCSAIWVVYVTGYAAIRARLAFLQGSQRTAARDAIWVLRETHERARFFFDVSLMGVGLAAVTVSTPRNDQAMMTWRMSRPVVWL